MTLNVPCPHPFSIAKIRDDLSSQDFLFWKLPNIVCFRLFGHAARYYTALSGRPVQHTQPPNPILSDRKDKRWTWSLVLFLLPPRQLVPEFCRRLPVLVSCFVVFNQADTRQSVGKGNFSAGQASTRLARGPSTSVGLLPSGMCSHFPSGSFLASVLSVFSLCRAAVKSGKQILLPLPPFCSFLKN